MTSYTPDDDMLTIAEVSDLFRETGQKASETTLNRWIAKHNVRVQREGRGPRLVSYTEMLQVHRDEVAKRDE
ncbi:hypothetical protein [Streptomyces sp. NPDC060366]|uniref:hypothetical protein n=1 Tax=Streptomyces sp. NPDC060366 TaxID=3347105 RepID=UPI003662BC12